MAEIILGIDHGNGNMKGSNVDFPCGLVRYTSEPGRFMNEDILEYQGTFYTLSETRMPFKADKTVDEDYFILTLFALALEAKSRGITLTGKDIVLGVGLPPADFSQQAPGFKKYFMEHAKHGISFKFNGKSVSCYLKDTFVSPQNFAAVMCYKASLFKQYRTVNCIDIGDGTVDLLVIRKGQPDLSVRVSDRSGMAILRSEIANVIQQNFGIHENIVAFSQNVINKLKAIKIRPETQKQWITQEQLVDVVQIWIAKDYLDVSDVKNFAYQVYWEKDDNLYWCKQLGISRVQIGNMAYRKNTDYERQRKDREKYILPDDLIKEFWKTNLKKLIVETESVIYAYSNFYVNKELSYEDLRKKARDAYSKLKDVYRTVVEVWFPLTDSDLKDYSKQSYDLAIDIQELLFLLNSDKGEEWVIGNFKLKLMKYYRSIEAWKEATDKLE